MILRIFIFRRVIKHLRSLCQVVRQEYVTRSGQIRMFFGLVFYDFASV